MTHKQWSVLTSSFEEEKKSLTNKRAKDSSDEARNEAHVLFHRDMLFRFGFRGP